MKDCLEVLPIFCLFDFLEKKKTNRKQETKRADMCIPKEHNQIQ